MMVIKGKSYRTNLSRTMQLRTMKKVQRATGFGWAALERFVREVDPEEPLVDVISQPKMQAWMWAWVLNAGDDMSLEEFDALEIGDVEFTSNDGGPEPSQEVEVVDAPPSAPTDGRRGAGDDVGAAQPARKKPAKKAAKASR